MRGYQLHPTTIGVMLHEHKEQEFLILDLTPFCYLTPFCLAHLIYGVIKSERPFDANFNHSALAIQDGI